MLVNSECQTVSYEKSTPPDELPPTVTDLESLSVGDRIEFWKTFTDDVVREFAEATGDTNALHLDDMFADKTRFGGRIVHRTPVSG